MAGLTATLKENPNIPRQEKIHAYLLALNQGDSACIWVLRDYGVTPSEALCLEELTPAEAEKLVNQGAKWDYVEPSSRRSVLEKQVEQGNVEMVRWLLAHKASPKIESDQWKAMKERKRIEIEGIQKENGTNDENSVATLKLLEKAEGKERPVR